ncbi:MAG: hypothetical protein V3U92_19735 [Cellulophaga sp.]
MTEETVKANIRKYLTTTNVAKSLITIAQAIGESPDVVREAIKPMMNKGEVKVSHMPGSNFTLYYIEGGTAPKQETPKPEKKPDVKKGRFVTDEELKTRIMQYMKDNKVGIQKSHLTRRVKGGAADLSRVVNSMIDSNEILVEDNLCYLPGLPLVRPKEKPKKTKTPKNLAIKTEAEIRQRRETLKYLKEKMFAHDTDVQDSLQILIDQYDWVLGENKNAK